MYPHLRQLTTRQPELAHEPEPRTENRAQRQPAAPTAREVLRARAALLARLVRRLLARPD